MTDILDDHELGIFVQSISVAGTFMDLNMTLDVWEEYVQDCLRRISALGLENSLVIYIRDHQRIRRLLN